MEQTTVFIHQTQENAQSKPNSDYRIVTFINGNKDIIDIIKNIIQSNYHP